MICVGEGRRSFISDSLPVRETKEKKKLDQKFLFMDQKPAIVGQLSLISVTKVNALRNTVSRQNYESHFLVNGCLNFTVRFKWIGY